MRLLLVGLVAFLGTAVRAQPVGPPPVPEIHCKHFVYGYPTGTPITNDLVIRDSYALSSNDATRFADWVAYRLSPQEVFGTLPLGRTWRTEPWLDAEETLEPSDYNGAFGAQAYNRGHLAPLASFKGVVGAADVNVLSNIVPQKTDLNQGPWGRLEDAERELVLRRAWLGLDRAPVWVMTGTLYDQPMAALPEADEPHVVPSGFWKIVVVQNGNAPSSVVAAAFVFGQDTPRNADPLDYLVSIDAVEAASGLDVFRLLPDDAEAVLESAEDRAEAEALLFPPSPD